MSSPSPRPAAAAAALDLRGQRHLEDADAEEEEEELVPETPPGGDAAGHYRSLAKQQQTDVAGLLSASVAAGSPRGGSSSLGVREIGAQATWSLSSCKPGFGVDQLRDESVDTYWQSDGQLPHLVNIQFRRKVAVRDVALYADFKLDESYTPSKVSVRCGANFNDLQEIEVVELSEPSGWVVIPLKDVHDRLVRAFMVQVAIIANHQQGRDTHLRQVKVHSPLVEKPVTTADPLVATWSDAADCRQFLNIR